MFKALFTESTIEDIEKIWDKLQKANKRLGDCYGEDSGHGGSNGTLEMGHSLGAKKGACTRAQNKLFNAIESYFGSDKIGLKNIEVYTALQNGEDISKIEKVK